MQKNIYIYVLKNKRFVSNRLTFLLTDIVTCGYPQTSVETTETRSLRWWQDKRDNKRERERKHDKDDQNKQINKQNDHGG